MLVDPDGSRQSDSRRIKWENEKKRKEKFRETTVDERVKQKQDLKSTSLFTAEYRLRSL